MTAAVMGAGSWGTTFAQILCDAGTETMLWCRSRNIIKLSNINTSRAGIVIKHAK